MTEATFQHTILGLDLTVTVEGDPGVPNKPSHNGIDPPDGGRAAEVEEITASIKIADGIEVELEDLDCVYVYTSEHSYIGVPKGEKRHVSLYDILAELGREKLEEGDE